MWCVWKIAHQNCSPDDFASLDSCKCFDNASTRQSAVSSFISPARDWNKWCSNYWIKKYPGILTSQFRLSDLWERCFHFDSTKHDRFSQGIQVTFTALTDLWGGQLETDRSMHSINTGFCPPGAPSGRSAQQSAKADSSAQPPKTIKYAIYLIIISYTSSIDSRVSLHKLYTCIILT
jgi:hypothetical protein